jgi:pentatricopeptide repeat protein
MVSKRRHHRALVCIGSGLLASSLLAVHGAYYFHSAGLEKGDSSNRRSYAMHERCHLAECSHLPFISRKLSVTCMESSIGLTSRDSFSHLETTNLSNCFSPVSKVAVKRPLDSPWDNRLHHEEGTAWDNYQQIMKDLIHQGRALKIKRAKHIIASRTLEEQDTMERAKEFLMSNQVWLEPPSLPLRCCTAPRSVPEATVEGIRNGFRDRLSEQRNRFLELLDNASEASCTAQFDYILRCLTYMGDVCAKTQMPGPARIAWRKLREIGAIPRENSVSTYLYILSVQLFMDDEISECNRNNWPESSKEYQIEVLDVASFHDLLYSPNEKTLTLRIKALVAMGDAEGAEDVLNSFPATDDNLARTRLRTFSPILARYCELKEFSKALRLYRQMHSLHGVVLDSDTYAQILSSLAAEGMFAIDAKEIPGVIELDFSAGSGPQLFNDICSHMETDLLELNEQSARLIYSALCKVFVSNEVLSWDTEGWLSNQNIVIGRVSVHPETGECPATGVRLRLLALDQCQRRHLHDQLLSMAATQHEDYGEKLKAKADSKGQRPSSRDGQFALLELSKFSTWLQQRNEPPFTAIVDGPNVAYFGHGDVHYSQVSLIVKNLEAMGENPIVLMPQKYASERFWLSSLNRSQELSDREVETMNELIAGEKMYVVPNGCLDDYYWMLSSVANQTQNVNSEVPVQDPGRLPGLRPMLVTNDRMRDHKLELMEPRLFRRWTSGHVVKYDIRPSELDEGSKRLAEFFPADSFSREIQSNRIAQDAGRIVWHFPVEGWSDLERFCVCLWPPNMSWDNFLSQ